LIKLFFEQKSTIRFQKEKKENAQRGLVRCCRCSECGNEMESRGGKREKKKRLTPISGASLLVVDDTTRRKPQQRKGEKYRSA
jgi:hypothetical protein